MRKPVGLTDLYLGTSKEAVTDPAHINFSQKQPKVKSANSPTLILTADLYATSSSANLTLRVISGNELSARLLNPRQVYALSQIKLTSNDGDVLNTVEFIPTGRDGEYTATVRVGLKGHICLVAYPTQLKNPPPEISRDFYQRLEVSSNPITIVSIKSAADDIEEATRQVQSNTDDIIQSLLAPMSGANGSSSDFFKMRGMASSDTRYPDAEHENARLSIQGTTEDLASRIAGLSNFVYTENTTKEVAAVTASAPLILAEKYKAYKDAIVEGSSSMTSAIESASFNPSNGNNVSHNIGHQNLTTSQYHLEATTIMDLRSPLLINNSQIQITDAKDQHTRAYLTQTSNVHSWTRSEKDYTVISNLITTYALENRVEMSMASSNVSGDQFIYGDSMTLQVGLSPPVTIALAVAKAKEAGVTSKEDIEKVEQQIKDLPRDLNILVEGRIVSHAITGDYSVSAGLDLIQYANASIFMRSNVQASLDSSIVFINCRVIRPPLLPLDARVQNVLIPIEPYPRADLPVEAAPYSIGTENRIPVPQAGGES